MTRGSRRAVLSLVVVALLSGCAARRGGEVDASLPDGAMPEAVEPAQALRALATSPDPAVRGRALAGLVRSEPAASLGRWASQGTYDPDPWVQALVSQALLDREDAPGREAALDFIGRRASDGVAAAEAAHRLVDLGDPAVAEAVRAAIAPAWEAQDAWRAAPRALVSWRLGDRGASAPIEAALRSGFIRDDPAFLAALRVHGDPAWAAALREGAASMEEIADAAAFVLAGWGDRAAARELDRVLSGSDVFAARTALERVAALPAVARASAAGAASRADAVAVRRAAAALARPSAGAASRAVGLADPFAAIVVLPSVMGLDDPARRAVLADALTHPDTAVREAAAAIVQRAAVPGLDSLLDALATDPADATRAAAAGARLAVGVR